MGSCLGTELTRRPNRDGVAARDGEEVGAGDTPRPVAEGRADTARADLPLDSELFERSSTARTCGRLATKPAAAPSGSTAPALAPGGALWPLAETCEEVEEPDRKAEPLPVASRRVLTAGPGRDDLC